MAVYRNLKVDIPKEHVTIERRNDGSPALIKYVLSVIYDRKKGYPIPKRTIIGYQCLDEVGKMHPTTQYRELFPDKWKKLTGATISPVVKRIGLFALSQAVNAKTGIKDVLDQTYGSEIANAIIDYAMYSIRLRTDVLSAYEDTVRDELLYNDTIYSDTWYSDLFSHKMTKEQNLLLRKKWALQCRESGVEEVWLCIDGSNDDCKSKGVEIAEKGAAKSGKNVNIVSFTYAVTEQGLPVTFDLYQGGLVDAKAMKKVIDFLSECGLKLKGVILDRGYCSKPTLKYLNDNSIPYIIMVKGEPEGFATIVEEYGEKIKMNYDYLIEDTHLFGVQKKVQLLKNYVHDDYLTLFFDYINGTDRITSLLDNLFDELHQARSAIACGLAPQIDSKFRHLIAITTEISKGQEKTVAKINTKALKKESDSKGLYSIVTSQEMPVSEVHAKYRSRDASEVQYRILKTQLGYGTIRVERTNSVYSKFLVSFVASIIRFEIEQAAKPLKKTVPQMVREVDHLEMQKICDLYAFTHTEKQRTIDLFSNLGVDAKELLDEAVQFENDRILGKIPVLRHRKTGPRKGSHNRQYDSDGNEISHKKGVKPGTKRPDFNKDGTLRKKPGVPVGTKRGKYNKDGSLRKKSGPKPKSEKQDAA